MPRTTPYIIYNKEEEETSQSPEPELSDDLKEKEGKFHKLWPHHTFRPQSFRQNTSGSSSQNAGGSGKRLRLRKKTAEKK